MALITNLLGTEVLYVLGQNPSPRPAAYSEGTTTSAMASAPVLTSGAVAAAGTTQGTATAVSGAFVNVATGTANQGILLPVSVPGAQLLVNNATGATIKVYPNGTDTIDGGTASAAVTLASANRGATYTCFVAGNWVSALIGAVSS